VQSLRAIARVPAIAGVRAKARIPAIADGIIWLFHVIGLLKSIGIQQAKKFLKHPKMNFHWILNPSCHNEIGYLGPVL
jgi:hypothetical protein